MQRYAFFAHPQNVISGMLSDNSRDICSIAVNKIQMIKAASHFKTLQINANESGVNKTNMGESKK